MFVIIYASPDPKLKLLTMSIRVSAHVVLQLTQDFVQRWGRKMKIDRRLVPWMRQKEFDIFKEVIANHQPLRCLEWGAGFSTLYFPTLLPASVQWQAIEHNAAWAARLKSINQSDNIKIHEVAPDNKNWQGDGSYEDFKHYLEYPRQLAPFDLIIVDGRARKHCLEMATSLLSERGVVILHDANRSQYHPAFSDYQYGHLFKDYHRGNGGVWVGSQNVPLTSVLDITANETIWQRYEQLVGFFR